MREEKSHKHLNKKRKSVREPEVRENIYLTRSLSRIPEVRQPQEEKSGGKEKQTSPAENEQLVDLTDEFFREFYRKKRIFVNEHAHGKRVKREGPCLRQRATSSARKSQKPSVNMFKLIQDFTWGARVVIKRMSASQISRIVDKDSLAAGIP